MGGAAITIAVLTLAATHTLDIHVDLLTAIILCILSCDQCLRRFRCGGRFVASDSSGLLIVRYL